MESSHKSLHFKTFYSGRSSNLVLGYVRPCQLWRHLSTRDHTRPCPQPGINQCGKPYVRVCSQGPRGRPNPDNDDTPSTSRDRVTTGLLFSGAAGTLAVFGAALTGRELFGQFHWTATDDLLVALRCSAPLLVLDAVLLGPRYDVLLGGAGRPGARRGAAGLRLATGHLSELLTRDSLAATLVLQQMCIVTAVQAVQARSPIPRGLEVGLVLLQEASKELLLRGLVAAGLAAWLTDRFFEAGADDVIRLPAVAAGALWALLGGAATVSPATVAGVTASTVAGGELALGDVMRLVTAVLLMAGTLPTLGNEADALRLGVASNLALVMASKEAAQGGEGAAAGEEPAAGGGYDEEMDDVEMEKLLYQYRLVDALNKVPSTAPPQLTYGLTWLRTLLRVGSINLTYALTGNLAASLLAAAASRLLLLTYVWAAPSELVSVSNRTSGGAD